MSLVRLINENGTHIFLNCLNKNIAPGGFIIVSSDEVNANSEILSAIASGFFKREALESTPPPEEPPNINLDHPPIQGDAANEESAVSQQTPPTADAIDPSEEETVEVEVPNVVKDDPDPEPTPEPTPEPELTDDEIAEQKGYYVHDIDREDPPDGKSFVKTRHGVKEGKSLDISMPPHMIDRFGDKIKEKPEEAEKKETVGGIEIINPAPEPPPSEMIGGIEIIDTSNSE